LGAGCFGDARVVCRFRDSIAPGFVSNDAKQSGDTVVLSQNGIDNQKREFSSRQETCSLKGGGAYRYHPTGFSWPIVGAELERFSIQVPFDSLEGALNKSFAFSSHSLLRQLFVGRNQRHELWRNSKSNVKPLDSSIEEH
jgi:hypothetical protein